MIVTRGLGRSGGSLVTFGLGGSSDFVWTYTHDPVYASFQSLLVRPVARSFQVLSRCSTLSAVSVAEEAASFATRFEAVCVTRVSSQWLFSVLEPRLGVHWDRPNIARSFRVTFSLWVNDNPD